MERKYWFAHLKRTVAVTTSALALSICCSAASGVLVTFKQKSDGIHPAAPLVADTHGNLYGTTAAGGTNAGRCATTTGCGTVFALSSNGSGGFTYSVLYRFTGGPDGTTPLGGLVLDSKGNLYGTTKLGGAQGYGSIYQLSPATGGGWNETVLYSFTATAGDGAWPVGNLVFDGSGNLYGVTQTAGNHGGGTAFRLSPNGDGTWAETVLYAFFSTLTDGYYPMAGLVIDTAGNLYGTTSTGGTGRGLYGTVFELSSSGGGTWVETVLYNFVGASDGCTPVASVSFDSAGNLFGTTKGCGGLGYAGTVFELSPSGSGWVEHTVHRFNTSNGDGIQPAASVVSDSAGNLYGTTYGGGAFGFGAVYKLMPNGDGTWKESGVHHFSGGIDGSNPEAAVIFGPGGSLYGTTYLGGQPNNWGVVVELNP